MEWPGIWAVDGWTVQAGGLCRRLGCGWVERAAVVACVVSEAGQFTRGMYRCLKVTEASISGLWVGWAV